MLAMFNYRSFGGRECCDFCIGARYNVFDYLLSYKLPEHLFITPTTSSQFFTASARNRYISDVTVAATAATPAATTTPTV